MRTENDQIGIRFLGSFQYLIDRIAVSHQRLTGPAVRLQAGARLLDQLFCILEQGSIGLIQLLALGFIQRIQFLRQHRNVAGDGHHRNTRIAREREAQREIERIGRVLRSVSSNQYLHLKQPVSLPASGHFQYSGYIAGLHRPGIPPAATRLASAGTRLPGSSI